MWRALVPSNPPPVSRDIVLAPYHVAASPDRRAHCSVLGFEPFRVTAVLAPELKPNALPELLLSLRAHRGPDQYAPIAIDVGAARIEREIDPADWLRWFLEDRDYEVIETTFKPGRTEPAFEVLCRTPDRKGLSHWRVIKEADCLFAFEASAPASVFTEYASRFELVGESLFPLTAPTRHLAEPFPRSVLCGLGGLSFRHPEAWRLTLDTQLKDEHEVPTAIRFDDGAPSAVLALATWESMRMGSVEQVIDRRLLDLAHLGFPSAPANPLELEAPARLGELVGITALCDSRHAEIRLGAGRIEDTWFCLSVIGPSRLASPLGWMESKRAFELALESIAPA